MLFNNLRASTALSLEGYSDVDDFRQSERYAHAESMPLSVKEFCVLRASFRLPSCNLSLVRTFPRIINGYDFSGKLLVVVPMNDVSSTRLNGKAVGQSLIIIKGRTNCTVCEPEGRLVAILAIPSEMLARKWSEFDDGHLLLRLPSAKLSGLQNFLRSTLELAASQPETVAAADFLSTLEDNLFLAFDEAMGAGEFHDCSDPAPLPRYKTLIDRVDQLLQFNPMEAANDSLADEIGVSVRTLQTASRSIFGLPLHRYSRLRRLWSLRRQLRTGSPCLTVKASALAHGFSHLSQLTDSYYKAFGELPSFTLAHAKRYP